MDEPDLSQYIINKQQGHAICRRCPIHCSSDKEDKAGEQIFSYKRVRSSDIRTGRLTEVNTVIGATNHKIEYKEELCNQHQLPLVGLKYNTKGQLINCYSNEVVPNCNCCVFDVNFKGRDSELVRREFDLKQHGWRQWNKTDKITYAAAAAAAAAIAAERYDEDIFSEKWETAAETEKKMLIESVVQSVEEDKRRTLLEKIHRKTASTGSSSKNNKLSASERYKVNIRKSSYVDPEDQISANN